MKFIRSIFIPWARGLNPWSKRLTWAKSLLCVSLLSACTSYAQSDRVHVAHCYRTCPQSSGGAEQQIVVHHLYAAVIEQESNLAEWVAYRVLGDSLGVASLLPRTWHDDPLLGTGSNNLEIDADVQLVQPDLSNAQDREYRVNEVQINAADRGRLAPMTSFAGTPYWNDLNNMSNMAPLPTDLRVGSWARLEQAINALASQVGDAYVVSGPLLPSQDPIANPSAYFKVVLASNRLSAFIFPGSLRQNDRYCAQLSTLEEVEAATNIDLFPVISSGELTLLGSLDVELGCGESE